ncbi:MAG: hybrid-cluster NAD(P)-dependent oxidoreductase [Motiliproteus sp.]
MDQMQSAQAVAFAPLICTDRIEETVDAATFCFRTADASPLGYKPGQFITFQVDVADEQLHRAYSLSSTPSRPESIAITVKRVPGGKVSNHLLDHLRPGHMLPGMAPAGEFNLIDCRATSKVLLFSAGSGITPCISIARWLLDTDPQAEIHFIYSARTAADVIMADELARLDAEHPNFNLERVLSQPETSADHQGRLDQSLFDRLVPEVAGYSLFTCGPAEYMATVKTCAQARGLDMDYFHQESFAPGAANDEGVDSGVSYQLQAPKFGKAASINGGQSLLEVMEGAGLPVIGACRSGVCGSCKCQVLAGEVDSSSQATLTDAEIAAGYVLACSSKARSDLVVEL